MKHRQDILFEIQAAMVARSRIDAGAAYALLDRAADEIERLRTALKPLAAVPLYCDKYPDDRDDCIHNCNALTVEMVKAARAALERVSG